MSRGASARLFVAIDPPMRVREELSEWARRVAAEARAHGGQRGGLRVLAAASLHLTLCFLGSRPVAEIDALAAAIGACEEHPCELSVGAPLWLPARHPRALAVEVHDREDELARVHTRVSSALSGAGDWQPERRRLRPHITLIRVGRGGFGGARAGSGRVRGEQPLPATPWLSFRPEAIVLYRSWLAPEGARYEALARGELTRAAH
jgi:RNA 2',3'-cyclic 3'-phosphodiesterase